jgi:hypothetical protein
MPVGVAARGVRGYNAAVQTIVLEFDSEKALQEAVEHLWDRLGVSGELLTEKVHDGCWRLELVAEQPVRAATLEKLGGRAVKV